jgi:hypothetical protein
MATHESNADYWAKQDAQRRELEALFERMRERWRREEEQEARRRERIRRLTFGLLGRPT